MDFKFYNGNSIPALGLGTWKSDDGQAYYAVKEAIRIGYRHFDCAFRYDNQEEIGQAFNESFQSGILDREELFITSKLWNNAHFPEHVLPALKQTLDELKLKYLDLYLMHWPVAIKPEIGFPVKGDDFVPIREIPIIETWRALEECVDAGLVKHIGVSNFSVKKLGRLIVEARIKPAANQIELHPLLQQNNLVGYCQEQGVHVTAYCPLGSRDRPARLIKDNDPDLLKHPVILEIAGKRGCSAAQVLINWAIQRGTSVIPKSANPERLKQNFDAQKVSLSPSDMNSIASLDKHFRFISGELWTMEGSPYTLKELWDE
jgi:alcohol dehydrogenase (NADP+)